MAPLDTN
jgi:glutamate synthase domain-containing protein 1